MKKFKEYLCVECSLFIKELLCTRGQCAIGAVQEEEHFIYSRLMKQSLKLKTGPAFPEFPHSSTVDDSVVKYEV